MRLREPGPERELGVHAVDAGDVRVGDERHVAASGDELAEPLQPAALDVDPRGSQNDVVGVPGDDVGDLRVDRAPLLVESPELVVVSSKWPFASFHALPRDVDVHVEPDDDRALPQQRTHLGRGDGSATEIGDHRLRALEHAADDLGLSRPERRLALLEQLERDVPVGLHVRQAEPPGDGRLTGAHETDEREMPV